MELKVRPVYGFAKIIGLIFADNPQAIFFTTRFGIHTFGLSYPIDVVILDDQNRVKVIKPNLPPNKIFFWNPKYSQVVELPWGTINKQRIKVGEKIILQFI